MDLDRDIVEAPDSIDELCGFRAECGCGRVHSVEMTGASIRKGAIDDVVGFAGEIGKGLKIAVVADRITARIAGEKTAQVLDADQHEVALYQIPDGAGGRPHADNESLAVTESFLEKADAAFAVGSGTVNDLVKLASFRRNIPYVAVATAPSMNGYTSAIAAISMRGVKRTVECHQPLAVIADLDVMVKAPLHLVRSGLGDLESKHTATADFRLAGLVRGTSYCPVPERVVFSAEQRAAEAAEGLDRADPESIAALTKALLISGLSMKLAGTSSPASGAEHLFSHFWDMTAQSAGRIEGWHGAQVGVASIVTATLYERLKKIEPSDIDVDAILEKRPSRPDIEMRILKHHGHLADQVAAEYFAKHLSDDDLRKELALIRDGWNDLWTKLDEVLRPSSQIRTVLKSAGAPITVQDLSLGPNHLRRAFSAALEIRNRFTVLDFAAELGLSKNLEDDVLEASCCL